MYQLARGPLLWLAVIVFVVGVVYRIVQLFVLTKKREKVAWPSRGVREDSPEERKLRPILSLRHSLLGRHPVMAIVSGVFHCCLFAAPLLGRGHNLMLREAWHFSLWSLPDAMTDVLTIVVLLGAFFLLVRRVLIPQVQAVSGSSEYFLLLVTAAPYLTGFLAYHQWWDYRTMITLHMLAAEAMLIAIPCSKLVHMIFFAFVRVLVRNESSPWRGSRAWST
ncbi:hypothetical protein HQ590_03235 [bacterium]|nr:hypothetical protein [bacterium]